MGSNFSFSIFSFKGLSSFTRFIIVVIFTLCTTHNFAQNNFRAEVRDSKTREALSGAAATIKV